MFDVPDNLIQPLYVDTSISYDLDLSKFPGLDDPDQMWEPALILASTWNGHECLNDENTKLQNRCTDLDSADVDNNLNSLTVMSELAFIDQQTLDDLIEDIREDNSTEYIDDQCREAPDDSDEDSNDISTYSDNLSGFTSFSGNGSGMYPKDKELSQSYDSSHDMICERLPSFEVWLRPVPNKIPVPKSNSLEDLQLTNFTMPAGVDTNYSSLLDRVS